MPSIISIGLPKTGTRSLMAALRHLGYTHTGDAFNAERLRLWCSGQFDTPDPSKLVGYHPGDREDVQDEPAFAFWRELAQANPEAKLIMTWRDFDGWYRSCGGLVVPHRVAPKNDQRRAYERLILAHRQDYTPAKEWLLGLVGGGWSYDREYHRSVFEAHLRDVMGEAVRSDIRGNPILILDICDGHDGWEPLCEFLGHDVPSIPFPHEHKTVRAA